MKALVILSLLLVASFAYEDLSDLWEAWKSFYGKTYTTEEEVFRYAVFRRNYAKVVKFNAENEDTKLAVNKFADLTANEFKSTKASCAFAETNQEFVESNTGYEFVEPEALPTTVDWRNKGAVTPIKDQGQCGSCWTFSTTGVLEGNYFIKQGKLYSFSEQQIVDCDTTTNQGCDGGWPYLAIKYAAANGLEQESDYPYTAQDGSCNFQKNKAITGLAKGYQFVTPNSTDQLKAAIVKQPVSVLIEADQDVFQMYSSGVIKAGCGASLDHAVLAVGYTKVGVLEAFIVKNSWGTDWGEQGYVYIWTNSAQNSGQGVCGILAQPVVPI